jgi:hypothetical protein
MRRSDLRSRTASLGLLPDQNTGTLRWNVFWSALCLVWTRLESRPGFVFVLLSFAFGLAISAVVPPLRGPDEIAHFLRIYSYTRGGLLPAAEVDGRKGIFIDHELYTQLSFFKNAGERFARNREQGLRYGEIMKEYPHPLHAEGQATKFMPFAGTEGYNPLRSIRSGGSHWKSARARFSEHAAPDARLGPDNIHGSCSVCHQAHSDTEVGICAHRDAAGIDLQSVGTQRRRCCAHVRSSDHSPLFQRRPAIWARLGAVAVDDALCAQQTAADRVCAVGVDGLPHGGAAAAVEQPRARCGPRFHFVAAMGTSSLRRYSGVASS